MKRKISILLTGIICFCLVMTNIGNIKVEAAETTTWEIPIGASGIDWGNFQWKNVQFSDDIMKGIESITYEDNGDDKEIGYDVCHLTIRTKILYDYATVEKIYQYLDTLLTIKHNEIGIILPLCDKTYRWNNNEYGVSYSNFKTNFITTTDGSSCHVPTSYIYDFNYSDGKEITCTLYDGYSGMYVQVWQGTTTYNGITCISTDYNPIQLRYDKYLEYLSQGIITIYDKSTPILKRNDFNGHYFLDDSPLAIPVFTDGVIRSSKDYSFL